MATSKTSGTRILRIGLAIQCAAAALFAWRYPTPINSVLFMDLGVDEELVFLVDRTLVGLLALMGLAVLVLSRAPTFVSIALIFLAWALATSFSHSDLVGRVTVAAHAVRYLSPIGLLLLLSDSGRAQLFGSRVLRLAIAVTFGVHGWEALQHHPAFVDLILGSLSFVEGADTSGLAQERAERVLTVIGVLDLVLAALILFVRSRVLALWMAFWGVATAASRWLERGEDGILQALLRTMNAATPFALFLHWRSPDR